MSRIIDTLTKQLTAAEVLLQKVVAIPDGRQGIYSIKYDRDTIREISNEEELWERETIEYLIILFGEGARQVNEFSKCLRDKSHYTDFREELKHDLDKSIAYLKALIKADKIKGELSFQHPISPEEKTPMVFISHSSKDKAFAEALVNLLEDMGMDSNNVFCSSVNGYGVGISQDIFETLRNLFNEHHLFVFFIHSPRYYNSPISLNEMGAAWVLKTDFCSFLTCDMDFKDMVGVIDKTKLSLKINTEQAASQLTELKTLLIEKFGLSSIDERKWERKRKQFLDTVCNLKYETTQDNDVIQKKSQKKAALRAYSVQEKKGQRVLIIKNDGEATATNVQIDIENKDEYDGTRPDLPVTYDELVAGAERKIILALVEGNSEAKVLFTWDDEAQKENKKRQTIDL